MAYTSQYLNMGLDPTTLGAVFGVRSTLQDQANQMQQFNQELQNRLGLGGTRLGTETKSREVAAIEAASAAIQDDLEDIKMLLVSLGAKYPEEDL